MMSIDEAIQYCKEKSCDNTYCSLEHRQLAEWLQELKLYRTSAKHIEIPNEEDVCKEGMKRYPRRWSGDRENGEKYDAFTDGADWAIKEIVSKIV